MPWTTLIDVDSLRDRLEDPDWVVVDCRFDLADPDAGRAAWQSAHLPGAVYAHLDHDLAGPVGPSTGRHPLPDPDAFAAWLGRHGVGEGVQVVVYDDGPGAMAARLWWLLRWVGHDAVAVLNGGLAAWRAVDGPLTDAAPIPTPRRFRPRPGRMPTVDTASLASAPHGWLLVDARAAPRYRGEREPVDPVAGHVPGAVNRPFTDNLDDDGRFRSAAALRADWEALLAGAGERPVACMCGSGATACHNLLALAYAGIDGAALYAGSWSEWIRDPERPVATGKEAG